MKNKKSLFTVLILLLILAVIYGSFYLWLSSYKYSLHKWHEGNSDKVVYDVMENYVYPGVGVEDVIEYLGEGSNKDSELKNKLLEPLDYVGENEAEYNVLIYHIDNALNDTNHKEDKYFIVIHNNDIVIETMLLSSLENFE